MSNRQVVGLILGVLALVVLSFSATSLIENLDANEIMVIQSPVSGDLKVCTEPGPYYQGFGKVTHYPRRGHLEFNGQTMPVQFNDGGQGFVIGSISWIMPLDVKNVIELHKNYGSYQAIEGQLVSTVVSKAITMTGPLMSSTESYASRKNEFLSLSSDQISNGVYKADSEDQRVKDELTNTTKTVRVVKLINGPDGKPIREEISPLIGFGIQTFNLKFRIEYNDKVTAQIAQQQESTMAIQIAIAKAKTAEQDAITAEQEGKAKAAQAKWGQEVEKAKAETLAQQEKMVAITKGEQLKEVAALSLAAAELKKQEDIALGEGEAKRRQLVMEADGALEKKLDAWVKVQGLYASAISAYKGNWVPQVSMGSNATNGPSNGALSMIDLLTIKAAKDLGLELEMSNHPKNFVEKPRQKEIN